MDGMYLFAGFTGAVTGATIGGLLGLYKGYSLANFQNACTAERLAEEAASKRADDKRTLGIIVNNLRNRIDSL